MTFDVRENGTVVDTLRRLPDFITGGGDVMVSVRDTVSRSLEERNIGISFIATKELRLGANSFLEPINFTREELGGIQRASIFSGDTRDSKNYQLRSLQFYPRDIELLANIQREYGNSVPIFLERKSMKEPLYVIFGHTSDSLRSIRRKCRVVPV